MYCSTSNAFRTRFFGITGPTGSSSSNSNSNYQAYYQINGITGDSSESYASVSLLSQSSPIAILSTSYDFTIPNGSFEIQYSFKAQSDHTGAITCKCVDSQTSAEIYSSQFFDSSLNANDNQIVCFQFVVVNNQLSEYRIQCSNLLDSNAYGVIKILQIT